MSNLSTVGVASNTTLVTTAEAVAATSAAKDIENPGGQGTRISGIVNVTTGAATTAVVVRVREDSLTGNVIGEALTHTIGAAVSATIPFDALDTSLTDDNKVYVVTVTQTAATGNGTVNHAVINVEPAVSAG